MSSQDITDSGNLEQVKTNQKQPLNINNLVNGSNFMEKAKPYLGAIEEAPQYIIDNIYILTGYRINYNSLKHILKSLFMVHNETINIWSHLIGCLIAIGLNIDTYFYEPFPDKSMVKWPIHLFLFSGILCMFFSSFYHLFFVKDPRTAKILLRLDYAGIAFLICGSTYPLTYYGFECKPTLKWFYLCLNTSASLIIFIITMMDFIYQEKYRTIKSLLYAFLGIFCATPLFHLLIAEGIQHSQYSTLSTFPLYMAMAFSDYLGLFIYAQRFPERKNPGKYDICGHSHQIMHCSNILGMIFTYFAALMHYKDRLEHQCPTAQVY